MTLRRLLLFVYCFACIGYTPTHGEQYLTQTVYGFLEFTTTIGNTVMIFSPHSAEVKAPEPKVTSQVNSVINTQPGSAAVEIKPTKVNVAPNPATSKTAVVKSKVEVVAGTTQSPKKSQKPAAKNVIIKVETVSGSPPVSKAKPPVIPSKTQAPVFKSNVVIVTTQKKEQKPNLVSKVVQVKSNDKVIVTVSPTKTQSPIIKSNVVVVGNKKKEPNVISKVVQVKSNDEPEVALVGNNIGEPEYDFLSRQPSEFVEETYKVVNLIPNSKFHLKPRTTPPEGNKNKATKRADAAHQTGLVTKLSASVVRDGVTTMLETKVIGTYISGKYAQVLQSTSKILPSHNKGKIQPSPSLRILKTAAPSLDKRNKQHHRQQQQIEPTPADNQHEETSSQDSQQNSIKSTRKLGGSYKPRFKNRRREPDENEDNIEQVTQASKKSTKNYSRNSKPNTSPQRSRNKTGRRKSATTTAKYSRREEAATTEAARSSPKRYSRRNGKPRATTPVAEATTAAAPSGGGGAKRGAFKPRTRDPPPTDASGLPSGSSKFKLNRSPGRWQYKTTPKPRVTIRKQPEDEQNKVETSSTTISSILEALVEQKPTSSNEVISSPQARSDDEVSLEGSETIASVVENDSTNQNKIDAPAFPVETIKVEISTPPDFKDVYYEIATIKTPYTFQVGNLKNTRYITVTSTFEKSLTPDPTPTTSPTEPLTENILATTSNFAKDNNLDSSIATLPPIYLASDMETPPLETLTETFSTTQTMFKTHILPLVRNGNDTSTTTLTQTYLITRLVTATKTLPPVEAYHFNPSKTLKEFNTRLDEAGSEMHLELEFGDQNDQDEEGNIRKIILPQDLDLIGSDFSLSDFDKSKLEGHLARHGNQSLSIMNQQPQLQPQPQLPQDQLQQLAYLKLLNSQQPAQLGQVITTSRPVVKVETVYETHVLPVTQGQNTILSTISKVKGTFLKTEYEFGTSTIPPQLGLPQIPQIPQIPPPINPLFPPPQQPQFAVTSSPVVQTTLVTQTESKVLKLTFGAKTAHTTVYSTKVVPTVMTSYVTTSVPVVAPTQAPFPGYFPPPPAYPPYPYVG